MSKNTGGPAFPRPVSEDDGRFGRNQEQYGAQDGMTLRDYLAATAPIGVDDANDFFFRAHGRNAGVAEMLAALAQLRTRYADFMLVELAK